MSRFPFKQCVNEYLTTVKKRYQPTTLAVMERRFKRMGRELVQLWNENKITTTNPKTLTDDDIRVYYTFLSQKTTDKGTIITPSSIKHDLNDLNNLCRFYKNRCVEDFSYRVPMSRKSEFHNRLETLSTDEIKTIYETAMAVSVVDFRRCRAYALVSLCISAGLRTVELQHLKTCYIDVSDDDRATVYLDYVKGQNVYGHDRTVPIIPQFVPIIRRYLDLSIPLIKDNNPTCPYAFYSLDSFTMLSDKTLRQIRRIVNDELGIKFDGRMCRRTYGQYLIDHGVRVETVSVLMGHSTTNTTERYYARLKDEKALNETFEKLQDTKL